jgi:fluoroacetyl-CoA thioesterase
MDLVPGLKSHSEHVVADADTAVALGSGDVPVLSTPRLIAWAEAASIAALEGRLEPPATSVGTQVIFQHLAACGVGAMVLVTAELVSVSGKLLRFAISAQDGERELARGEVVRAIVDRERFLERVTTPGT